MSHEQGFAGLWVRRIRIYLHSMARKLYNLRLLADSRLRESAFAAFLDAYAASIDADPICYSPRARRPIDALWEDFVQISSDANNAVTQHAAKRSRS